MWFTTITIEGSYKTSYHLLRIIPLLPPHKEREIKLHASLTLVPFISHQHKPDVRRVFAEVPEKLVGGLCRSHQPRGYGRQIWCQILVQQDQYRLVELVW